MTSNVVDCLAEVRAPKAVNDVRSRARKTGAGIWRRSYGADFWSRFLSTCQGPNSLTCRTETPHDIHADCTRDGIIRELTQHQQQVRHHFQLMQQYLSCFA